MTGVFILIAGLLAIPSAIAQSLRPGWGATPFSENGQRGYTFRVWAPNAVSVSVPGVFNGWNGTANFLVQEGTSGVWSADIPGVLPNQAYKYLINGFIWKRDPHGRRVIHTSSDSLTYDPLVFDWQHIQPALPPLDELVVYEMHIGTFYDSTPVNGLPGTFSDAIAKLDHLRALGINAVEVMPLAEFPGDHSWGYNPSDLFAVENIGYGGPDGFKQFIKACHERGIAVLLDTEHNHYGPAELDLWNFDGWTGDGNGGGIYFYQDAARCCTPWGPRPNYERPEVRRYIKDNIRMWLHEYHVDGFRWDSPYHMRYTTNNAPIPEGSTLISEILAESAAEFPGRIQIAENTGLDLGFDAEWQVGFHHGIVDQLSPASDTSRNMNTIAFWISTASTSRRVIYTESHDEVGDLNGKHRVPRRIDPVTPASLKARRLSNLGAVVALTAPGIPMLFMGQEMLEDRQFSTLNPLFWARTNTFQGVFRLYKDLIHLRRNYWGATAGLKGNNVNILLNDNSSKRIAYHRWKNGGASDDVVIVCNFSSNFVNDAIIPFPFTGNWNAHFNSDSLRYFTNNSGFGSTSVTASGVSPTAPVSLAPYSAIIFSRANLPPADTDEDLIPDAWESAHGLNPLSPADARANPDGDLFDNLDEYRNGFDPHVWNPPLSAFTGMTVAGTFNGWDPTSGNMELVHHYVWQFIGAFSQPTDLVFKFTANGDWNANWGDNNPAFTNAPFYGGAESFGSNIVVAGPLDGTYRITFNEQSRAYSVEKLATAFSNMAVAGTFNGWDTATRNMKLLHHYKWQADTTLVHHIGAEFKYAANDTWSNNWGDSQQPSALLPIAGTGQFYGANVQINGTLYGIYRFTFNENDATYRAERVPDADRNLNTIPDWWEQWHGLDGSSPPDADGDGMDNVAEYRADTNPNDPSSLLQINALEQIPAVDMLSIMWKGGIVAPQYLEQAESLDGPWMRIFTNVPPTPATNQLQLHTDSTCVVFRIIVP